MWKKPLMFTMYRIVTYLSSLLCVDISCATGLCQCNKQLSELLPLWKQMKYAAGLVEGVSECEFCHFNLTFINYCFDGLSCTNTGPKHLCSYIILTKIWYRLVWTLKKVIILKGISPRSQVDFCVTLRHPSSCII